MLARHPPAARTHGSRSTQTRDARGEREGGLPCLTHNIGAGSQILDGHCTTKSPANEHNMRPRGVQHTKHVRFTGVRMLVGIRIFLKCQLVSAFCISPNFYAELPAVVYMACCYALEMITSRDARIASMALNRIAFYNELPALLGLSRRYVQQLTHPHHGPSGDKHRSLEFPKPFWVSRSGIRVWLVRDLESWALDVRRYQKRRKASTNRYGSTLLDRPELADELLGRSL